MFTCLLKAFKFCSFTPDQVKNYLTILQADKFTEKMVCFVSNTLKYALKTSTAVE